MPLLSTTDYTFSIYTNDYTNIYLFQKRVVFFCYNTDIQSNILQGNRGACHPLVETTGIYINSQIYV